MAARDAFYVVEMEVTPTLEELDQMPQDLVETILLFKAVRNIALYGGELDV